VALPTKDRLLEAAWACVRDGGLAAASSRAITARAGANLGAITYPFGSKDELLAEVFVTAIRRLADPAMDALQQAEVDPVARVFQAIARLQDSLNGSADEAPVYLEILLQSRRMLSLRDHVEDLFTELRTVLAVQMAEQRAAGSLPAWVEPHPMAALLLAVAQGVVLETTIDPNGPQQAAIASQFAHLLLASRQSEHPT
jgi:AcrR family transcriptional regulator